MPRRWLVWWHVHSEHHVFRYEAMGLSLPYSSTMAAEDNEKAESAAGLGSRH
jgi:hypothetical protein